MTALPTPARTGELAWVAEDSGWDGIGFADSQNIAADPYVALTTAANATTHLLLRTSVTNPVTRDASVTANAIASVHAESGGRAVLGIGRGDSSVSKIGRRPATIEEFATHLQSLRAYLAGEEVDRGTAHGGNAWISGRQDLPPVPLDVAASGPKALEVAVRYGDQITFAVGRDVERLGALVSQVRRTATALGRDPAHLRLGAFINGVAHPDPVRACNLARGPVATFARFGARSATGPSAGRLMEIANAYDMRGHATAIAVDRGIVTDEFVQAFGVVGTPSQCRDALVPLLDLPLDHLVLIGPGEDVDFDEKMACWRLLGEEVIRRLP